MMRYGYVNRWTPEVAGKEAPLVNPKVNERGYLKLVVLH